MYYHFMNTKTTSKFNVEITMILACTKKNFVLMLE